MKLEDLYTEVTRELTIFEANEDEEMTDGEWLDVFYGLLVKFVNTVDMERGSLFGGN